MTQPSYRELENKNDKTTCQFFTSTHEDLLKNGKEYMRNIASQCIIVATIIATMVFQEAFNVP